ncbi:GroES-like protein [Laetiporus sulphureus 93-53]|uniref:GroES-like protein n=1 Tax=Laetiporus sulphureus 93-53 TaxID=1314785 RepID=A0A165BK63_9APHY|nr:GroES-like protein [Laetiporus sulphureus 93-53]KZT01209.1 GroES-like protein [Laetiporus sulphureus 93-53]
MSFTPPKTYKAFAFLERGGDLHEVQVDWKDPAPGEVVVKVLACGVCASDEITKQGWFASTVYPRIPGHEIVGDVVAIPPGETHWKVGDRVGAGWHSGQCQSCAHCRRGDFCGCHTSAVPNGVGRDGGYAEYAHLRSEALAAIPKDINPAEAAPLLCAGVTTFNSLRNMGCTPPDIVAIQGIGGLGHLGIQFARQMGFRTIALSTTTDKKELALKLGAHDFIAGTGAEQAEALQKLGGAKCIMATAPNMQAMTELLGGLTYGGELLVLALTTETFEVPVVPLVAKRLSIRGWPVGSAQDSEDTIAFAKAQGVKTMIETFPLDKAPEAFNRRASARFRAVIVP